MSNSAPITRSRAQRQENEDTSSPLKHKKAQSTRSRSTRSTLKVFQDAPLSTPSKTTGSRQSKTPLQPTSTNILPKSSVSSGKLQKGDGALDFSKPAALKPVVTIDTPEEESQASSKPMPSAETETSNEVDADPSQDKRLSRLLARRLLSQSSASLDTPVRNRIVPLGLQSTLSHSTPSMLATPPRQISYSDLLSPFLSDSKIPTLNPIFHVEDLLLPLAISPLALSQAYLNALGPLTLNHQSIYASPLSQSGAVLQPTLSSNMTPPATHVSTHRLDRSPKAKMRYSPSRQQWFSVDQETGSPRVAEEERVAMASPGSPTRRGVPLKMSGLQLLEKKQSDRKQHVELGRGFPSPLAKTSKMATPVNAGSEDKDLDDVRRLREASLEFDFVRATGSPLSAKAGNGNVSRIHSDSFTAPPVKQANDLQTMSSSIPAGFAEFLAKTRVVSEPILTSHSAAATEENAESLRSASSRRRSKRKKAKLPVPEPDAKPLSWNALQQKFIEAQVSEEYETIRSTYEKVAEELESTPVPAKQTGGSEDKEAQQESSTLADETAVSTDDVSCSIVA